MYIALEGIDGCGKSTVAKLLHSIYLGSVLTKEPGSEHDKICSELRKLILGNEASNEVKMLMFIADRLQHLNKVVIPALKSGKMVISDRCYISSLVYQGGEFGVDVVDNLMRKFTFIEPDIIFYLDVDPKIALTRIKKRIEQPNCYDNDLEARRKAYLSVIRGKKNVVTIDANQYLNIVMLQIMLHIQNGTKIRIVINGKEVEHLLKPQYDTPISFSYEVK